MKLNLGLFIILFFTSLNQIVAQNPCDDLTILHDYRWRNDNGGETSATWRAAINTATIISTYSNIRLRFVVTTFCPCIHCSGDNQTLKLQYSRDESTWTDITTSDANHFQLSLSNNFADGDATTRQLYWLGDVNAPGRMTESTSSFILTTDDAEYEYCFKPTQHALNGQYYFRIHFSGNATYNLSAVATFNVPDVIFYDGSDSTPDIYLGQTNQVIGYFEMISDMEGPELKSANIKLNGTRTGVSNLKLWASSDATFSAASDIQLGSTIIADPGDNSSAEFNNITRTITTSTTSFFLTADLSSNATGSIQGNIVNNSSLIVSGASLSTHINNAPLSSRSVVLANEPIVTTAAITNVAMQSASCGGNVTADGGDPVTERGICWSTSLNPTLDDAYTTDGSGIGTYTSILTGLSGDTEYHVRAYATNSVRTVYGSDETFTTLHGVTFTDGSEFSPTINPGLPEQKIGRFKLEAVDWDSYLESVTIKLNGLRSGYSNFKLNYSDEGGSGQLGATVAVDPGHGQSITFNGFSDEIDKWGQKFYYLRADVAANVVGEIQGIIAENNSLAINNAELSNTISNAALSDVDASLSVQLSTFSAQTTKNSILLRWTTESEVDNLGFIIERSVVPDHNQQVYRDVKWQPIASYQTHASLKGQGSNSCQTEYKYTDIAIQSNMIYKYRLSDIDLEGNITVLEIIEISSEIQIPNETCLEAPFPNPFNPQTTISYTIAEQAFVTLNVYDVNGRLVSKLSNTHQSPGIYNIIWSGANNLGGHAASGTYIIRLIAGKNVKYQKVVLMR